MNNILDMAKSLVKDAFNASYELFKVMIPILILVKVLQEMGMIQYLAYPLRPVMELVGLPAEMGLVWAFAIINNIYTGMIVLISLIGDNPLTTAQATILGMLMLVGHGLPVECAIARRSGARFLFQCFMRLFGAFVFAFILHQIYSRTGTLQDPALMLFSAENTANASISTWAIEQVKNLASIVIVIFSLLVMMRLLQAIRAIDFMNWLLRPVLKLIGIGPKASAITVIGLTMGLSYGGGLIINEANRGTVDKEDIFYSLTLMGLCHSIIEDTLLIMLIGGHISGIFWGRLILSVIAMAIIVQIIRRLPNTIKNRYLWVAN